MEPKTKKNVQEISFVLHNLFILHPNPSSKYKVRTIVSRVDNNNGFRKVSEKYTFKVSNNLVQSKQRACYLVLLEKTKNEGQNSQYVEIGRGEINLSQIIKNQQSKGQMTNNGVVVGTKSYNYNRIIGKYSYLVSKVESIRSQKKQKQVQTINKTPCKSSPNKQKQKEKSSFMFEKSIQEQQRSLQSKLKQLTSSMNGILNNRQLEQANQYYQPLIRNQLLSIKESALDQNQYLYKYDDNFAQKIHLSSANPTQLNVLIIKNLRIENHTKKRQGNSLDQTVKVENPKVDLTTKKKSDKKMEEILLVFYQLYQERRVRKRLIEIYLLLYLNKDNRNLNHQIFYLPQTKNKLLLEISFLGDYASKFRNLHGVIQPSVLKSRLVQLFDMDQLEKGIMICQIQSCNAIDSQEARAYKKQFPIFDKIMRKYGNVSQFVKKIRPPQIKQEFPVKQIRTLDNNLKDTLYSNFHQNKELKNIKRKRYTTSVDQQSGKLEVMTPFISRYNRSQINSKYNLSLSSKNGTKFQSKSIRAFPSMIQSIVKKENKKKNNSNDIKYRLYIESTQCQIYEMKDKGTKFLLKLTMNNKNQNKKLVIGQSDWHPLNIEFKQFAIKDFLYVQILLNKRNTSVYKRVGKCNIMMSEMQDSQNKYKFFIFREGKEIGYLVFKFKMFQKDTDQRSQSFYYQQEYQRKSLLRSRDRYLIQKSRYQDLSESNIIQTETDQSLDKIDYREEQKPLQISFYSKHIEAANTKMHQISQKVSEGRFSEILQNEDFQNGEAINRRF